MFVVAKADTRVETIAAQEMLKLLFGFDGALLGFLITSYTLSGNSEKPFATYLADQFYRLILNVITRLLFAGMSFLTSYFAFVPPFIFVILTGYFAHSVALTLMEIAHLLTVGTYEFINRNKTGKEIFTAFAGPQHLQIPQRPNSNQRKTK